MLRYQFGSDRADGAHGAVAIRNDFESHLARVLILYPAARVEAADGGPILPPSRPHVAARPRQELVSRERSVSFEDPGEPGYEDEGEQPTAEGQPEDPPGGVAVGNEGVSLFEVGDRQQQVEGVSSGVEPGLGRAGLRWREHARVGVVGVIEDAVSYTHLRAHETDSYLVCR